MSETEKGIKWWIRYVIVPLIGGGGLIALIIALVNQPHVSKSIEEPVSTQNVNTRKYIGSEVRAASSDEQFHPATVIILFIPSRGGGPDSKGVIAGRVSGLDDPMRYRIVIYALTDRWYVQPTINEPLIVIQDDGNWESTTHLGFEYAALIVRSSFDPPESLDAIPGGDGVIAFTRVGATIHP
jgi:hypothetical protein